MCLRSTINVHWDRLCILQCMSKYRIFKNAERHDICVMTSRPAVKAEWTDLQDLCWVSRVPNDQLLGLALLSSR